MKYYKQIRNDVVVCVGAGSSVPTDATEITKDEYDAERKTISDADAKRKADAEAAAEAAAKKAEEEAAKAAEEAAARKAVVDDYVSKVQSGETELSAVPEEYRSEVDAVINPPKTDEERLAAVEEQTATMQAAMDDLMMMVAETAAGTEV